MNHHDIENLLQSLTPAAPSQALRERVAHELALDDQWLGETSLPHPATTPRRFHFLPRWLPATGWSALGAAAAVTVMVLVPDNQPNNLLNNQVVSGEKTPPALLPVGTVREVMDTQVQGIRYNQQSRLPEQHLKVFSLERQAWIDPRDGAEITIEQPHEERVVLPVSFQ